MNNACPSCGAVYAVTARDVGRKIKCKKCSTALRVDDTGLIVDAPVAPVAAAVVEEDEAPVVVPKKGRRDDDDEEPAPKIKKPGRAYSGGPGLMTQIGGVPTILFAVGLFMSVWFTFQQGPIAEATVARAGMAPLRLKMDMSADMEGTKGEPEKVKQVMERYEKKTKDASKETAETTIDTIRGVKWDRYGQLIGFVVLAFGCIGYLRTEQSPVMQYVAGVILAGMMLAMFSQASGCSGGRNELMNPDKLVGKSGKGGFDFP